jgi:hypothetical protein
LVLLFLHSFQSCLSAFIIAADPRSSQPAGFFFNCFDSFFALTLPRWILAVSQPLQ